MTSYEELFQGKLYNTREKNKPSTMKTPSPRSCLPVSAFGYYPRQKSIHCNQEGQKLRPGELLLVPLPGSRCYACSVCRSNDTGSSLTPGTLCRRTGGTTILRPGPYTAATTAQPITTAPVHTGGTSPSLTKKDGYLSRRDPVITGQSSPSRFSWILLTLQKGMGRK